MHIIYFYASDGSDATSINPNFAGPADGQLTKKRGREFKPFGILAPDSSPVAGGINAYLFKVSFNPTAANVSVSGRVLTANDIGLRNAYVVLTDSQGVTRTALSSSFGYYSFDNVQVGETYLIGVSSKRYQFATHVVSVSDNLTGVDLIADP